MGWFHQEETTAWQKTKALVALMAGGFLKLSSIPSSHFHGSQLLSYLTELYMGWGMELNLKSSSLTCRKP